MLRKTLLPIILILNISAVVMSDVAFYLIIGSIISLSVLLIFELITKKSQENDPGDMVEQEASFQKEVEEEPETEIIQPDILLQEEPEVVDNSAHLFYIKECLPIIEILSKNTREFEEKTLQELFKEFENIWAESDTIVRNSEKSMESIFDPTIENNLGYVLNASKEINNDFSNFMPVLDVMSKLTEKFISASVDSFNEITQTTKDIVDLAEQVKVISINVRIEAARVKDSGGFQVLGNDISNFADKTSKVAITTNEKIKDTMTHIESLKNELSNHLSNVENMAKVIYGKVSPFESILNTSSDSVMQIIKNLNVISGDLQHDLRNTISRLQYQDITNQEADHIVEILKQIENVELLSSEIRIKLTKDEEKSIRTNIINYLRKVSTTANEENVVEDFARLWGIDVIEDDRDSGTETDDGVFMF